MPPVSLMIKPVSGSCNMHCSYCFYRDTVCRRNSKSLPVMPDATLETLIAKTLSHADGSCLIAFQGGEPTLAGLPFFQKAIEFVRKYNTKNIAVRYAFQTNGLAVTPEWAAFFRSSRILVGLSLDGPPEIHNANRPDTAGKPTYEAAAAAAGMLAKAGTDFNILSVVTNRTADHTEEVYRFFKKRRFKYLQFIPCLAPLNGPALPSVSQRNGVDPKKNAAAYPLTAEAYARFLKELFSLWYEDIRNGKYTSIRQFDNYISILQGKSPEACDMGGTCSVQYVAESDGSMYPCDFYALDEYNLGNINSVSFSELDAVRRKISFIEESAYPAPECLKCRYFALCRGGCKRHRIMNNCSSGGISAEPFPLNYFCPAYIDFFDSCLDRMADIVRRL